MQNHNVRYQTLWNFDATSNLRTGSKFFEVISSDLLFKMAQFVLAGSLSAKLELPLSKLLQALSFQVHHTPFELPC